MKLRNKIKLQQNEFDDKINEYEKEIQKLRIQAEVQNILQHETETNLNKEIEKLTDVKKQQKKVIENQRKTINKLKTNLIKLEKEEYNLQYVNKLLNQENKEYKTTVIKLAEKPQTNNIHIQNLTIFDENIITKRFKTALKDVDPTDLDEGQKSISRLIAPCLKNDDGSKMIHCSNVSRNIFVKKLPDNTIERDINCNKLCKLIHPIASYKANELLSIEEQKEKDSYRLEELRKIIPQRENKIKSMNATLKGIQPNSKRYEHQEECINREIQCQENDIRELRRLESCGVKLSYKINEKFQDAVFDIRKLDTNNDKFVKHIKEDL
jgi:chromosome segregation ATPase